MDGSGATRLNLASACSSEGRPNFLLRSIRVRRAILVAAALCASCCAQNGADIATKCVLAGTVVDAISGLPVGAVEISATSLAKDGGEVEAAPDSASSDANGRFTFDGLPPGRYVLQSYREGYTAPDRRPGTGSEIVALVPGQHIENAVVTLMPGGTISGRITDEAGTSVSGASLQALKYSYRDGKRELEEMASTSTNVRGEYRLTGLAKGKYYLRVTSPHWPGSNAGKDKAYVPLYYADATDLGGAAELEVNNGEVVTGIDLSIGPRPAVSIKGRVIGPTSSSHVNGVEVTLLSDQGNTFFSPGQMSTDAEGGFKFSEIPPGSYVLVAQLDSNAQPDTTMWGRRSVEVSDGNVEDITVLLGQGVSVAGRIRVEGDAEFDVSSLKASLEPQEGLTLNSLMPVVEDASVGHDGTFTFRHVPEGTYNINFFPLPAGLNLGEPDGSVVLERGITVGPSQGTPRLDLVVSPASARIEGTVSGDGPVAGASVALVPEPRRRTQSRFYRMSVSNRLGKFTFRSVAPGDYKLFAWDEIESGAFMDPEFLREYEDRGQLVHVDQSTNASVQLKMIPVSTSR
jgi:protocatechuate 3,4-dioxygenase beta subunit